MSDNVVLNAGEGGSSVRTDDVGGIQYQVVKLDVGGDGLSVPVVGTLPVSGTVTVTEAAPTVVRNGQVAIAVTGTAVAIAATTAVKYVVVQALSGNSGSIWVGSSAVTNGPTGNGCELQPGQPTSLAIADLASVYINGTAGDRACYIGS